MGAGDKPGSGQYPGRSTYGRDYLPGAFGSRGVSGHWTHGRDVVYGTIGAISARSVGGRALAAQTAHEQALSARPIWDTAIVIDTDVDGDINTDLPENSAPMMTMDSRLLKCNTQLYPPGLLSARPILDPAIAIDTDVSTDINTDMPENSAPMINMDSRLLKCDTQVYPPGRDTQGC